MPYPGKYTAERLGIRRNRAAANLPQSTAAAIFTITGGRVLINAILGRVTTVIQTQANNAKLISNPTVGSDVDLCAVTDITADAVGTLYGITGTFATALQTANALIIPALPIVVPIGSIDFSCSASSTGQVEWSIWYMPLDSSARLVAA